MIRKRWTLTEFAPSLPNGDFFLLANLGPKNSLQQRKTLSIGDLRLKIIIQQKLFLTMCNAHCLLHDRCVVQRCRSHFFECPTWTDFKKRTLESRV